MIILIVMLKQKWTVELKNIIQEKIKIYFGKYLITNNGRVHKKYDEKKAKDYMKNTNLLVKVDLGIGKGIANVWGVGLVNTRQKN